MRVRQSQVGHVEPRSDRVHAGQWRYLSLLLQVTFNILVLGVKWSVECESKMFTHFLDGLFMGSGIIGAVSIFQELCTAGEEHPVWVGGHVSPEPGPGVPGRQESDQGPAGGGHQEEVVRQTVSQTQVSRV